MTAHASLPQEIKGCTIIQKHCFYACTLYFTGIDYLNSVLSSDNALHPSSAH